MDEQKNTDPPAGLSSRSGTISSRCQCNVRRGSRYPYRYEQCGKPAKGILANGTIACGVHLAAERRRLDGERAWRAELNADRMFREEVVNALEVEDIDKVTNLDAKKRTVVVSFDWLMALLNK